MEKSKEAGTTDKMVELFKLTYKDGGTRYIFSTKQKIADMIQLLELKESDYIPVPVMVEQITQEVV